MAYGNLVPSDQSRQLTAKREAEKRMGELARQLNMPDKAWYVAERKERNGEVQYVGDWTKIGLLWLLQMDDRVLMLIETEVIRSCLDNKGIAVGRCEIGFKNGARFRSTGRAAMAEFGNMPMSHTDDMAETRAMKRAAVLATANGLIDHPVVVEIEEVGDSGKQ